LFFIDSPVSLLVLQIKNLARLSPQEIQSDMTKFKQAIGIEEPMAVVVTNENASELRNQLNTNDSGPDVIATADDTAIAMSTETDVVNTSDNHEAS
jgi:hypothetical protein